MDLVTCPTCRTPLDPAKDVSPRDGRFVCWKCGTHPIVPAADPLDNLIFPDDAAPKPQPCEGGHWLGALGWHAVAGANDKAVFSATAGAPVHYYVNVPGSWRMEE